VYFCKVLASKMFDYDHIYHAFAKGKMAPFYDKMYPGLLLFAANTLGDRLAYLAEDCVQDAVMNTYLNLSRIDDATHWRYFLLQCIRNRALNMLRHENVSDAYHTSGEKSEEIERDISYAMIRQETLDALYAAIDSLPDIYREVFDLSFEQGLKNSEIAAMLDVAEITVKKRKARLLDILRERLGKSPDEIIAILITADIALRA
ncbi:MAG: sigma-70 family RNA polymerase sigma factor, partial [Muribaculaceae bacterium]|nr:sigma-70 family RNA polymerase sigma factor [Muribaculaceae bacterium]